MSVGRSGAAFAHGVGMVEVVAHEADGRGGIVVVFRLPERGMPRLPIRFTTPGLVDERFPVGARFWMVLERVQRSAL